MADLFDDEISAKPQNSHAALQYVEDANGDWVSLKTTMLGGGGGGIASSVSVTNFPGTQNVAVTLPVEISNFPSTQPVSGPLTNTQLRAAPVDVNIASGGTVGLTDAQLRASAVPVSGTVAISGTVPVSFTQTGLTDAQLRASPVPVSGTVAVTGTFYQATQPVSGPLTDAQLRASAVPVSSTVTNFPATQAVSGTVAISGTVPVSFTQTGLTDTQLRASAVPVSLASVPTHAVTLTSTTISNFPATQAVSGTVAATQSGTWSIQGFTASGATPTGNPVRVGAMARTTNQTAVTDGQVSNVVTDKVGRLVTAPHQIRDLIDSNYATCSNTTTAVSLIAATAATFNDIVGLVITNSSTSTGTWVEILDAAVIKFLIWVPANGGGPINLPVPLKQATVNTAWTVRTQSATTQVVVCAQSVRNI